VTAPIYGNDPTIAKLAKIERRMSRIEFRIGGGVPQPRWTTPSLLNGCADVGAPFEPFAWRVGIGGGIQFRGRLSLPASASLGVVAFEIPLATDSHGAKLAAFANDFELAAVVDVDGTRTAASYTFDSSTGEVTVYTMA
jgi:hypothetical protein